jgi:hypothetical protein
VGSSFCFSCLEFMKVQFWCFVTKVRLKNKIKSKIK